MTDSTFSEVTLNYTEEHQGAGGRPVKVPGLFFIRIPVFFGSGETLVGVRLRYRLADGKVVWSIMMFAPELIVRDEFMKAVEVAAKSDLQPRILLGDPDRPGVLS